jgi:hypothetical protein
MVTVKCLSCDADNDPQATGGYCEACGKRLPPAASYTSARRPRAHLGETDNVLPGPRSRASEALFLILVVQLLAGGLFLVLGPVVFGERLPHDYLSLLMWFTVPPVLLLGALAYLARWFPLASAVTALALQTVWLGVGFAISVSMALLWLPVSLGVLGLLGWPIYVSGKPS